MVSSSIQISESSCFGWKAVKSSHIFNLKCEGKSALSRQYLKEIIWSGLLMLIVNISTSASCNWVLSRSSLSPQQRKRITPEWSEYQSVRESGRTAGTFLLQPCLRCEDNTVKTVCLSGLIKEISKLINI